MSGEADILGRKEDEDMDIEGTLAWIRELELRRVALQLPDELMHMVHALLLAHTICNLCPSLDYPPPSPPPAINHSSCSLHKTPP